MDYSRNNRKLRDFCLLLAGAEVLLLFWIYLSVLQAAGSLRGLYLAGGLVSVLLLAAEGALLYKSVKTDLGRPEMIAGWVIGGILFVAFTFLAQKTLWIRLIGTDSALLQSALSLILMLGAFFLYYWTIRTLQPAEKKPLRQ